MDETLFEEVNCFMTKNGYDEDVVQRCGKARDVEAAIERLEAEALDQAVLTVTLQTFPHIKRPPDWLIVS